MKKLKILAMVLVVLSVLMNFSLSVTADGNNDATDNIDVTATSAEGAPTFEVNAKGAILMEVTTGKVLFEQTPDVSNAPASITKVMTALLVMEAVDSGKITLQDQVTASEHAASLGGTQIWLKPGETMSVDDLMKAMMVNSANDAAVALAEYVSGTEESFVAEMNKKAAMLGMKNTHFDNCHGLDGDTHMTTARDIGIVSCELLKHEKITEYSKIWMDSLRDGQTGLVNTNRLIRFYEYATGLKTGTTSKAGRCVTASAKKGDLHLVAVVLGSDNGDDRFNHAKKMLEWGFANYAMIKPEIPADCIVPVKVLGGMEKEVMPNAVNAELLLIEKNQEGLLEFKAQINEDVEAPVAKGQTLGKIIVSANNQQVAEIQLVAPNDIGKMTFGSALGLLVNELFCRTGES